MKLNELKRSVKEETKKNIENSLQYLNEKETIQQKENYIKYYYKNSLDALYKKNQAKTECQKIKVLKNIIKNYYQKIFNKHITKVENAEKMINSDLKINTILINIEWKKSRTWGKTRMQQLKYFIITNKKKFLQAQPLDVDMTKEVQQLLKHLTNASY